MKASYVFLSACVSIGLLAGCADSGLSSSTPTLTGPSIGTPSLRSQSGAAYFRSHRVRVALQRLTYLHSFTGDPDGQYPDGALVSLNGTLYGATSGGGTEANGTVYSLTPLGSESVLYSFAGSPDGEIPSGGLASLGGTLYGPTYSGGAGFGTVYSLTPSGSEKVIQRFYNGSDGARPDAGLTVVGNRLYGTTAFGGDYDHGTVYSLKTSGAEGVLHSFAGGAGDGQTPRAPLLGDGNVLYGTTNYGGTYGEGTLFAVDRSTGSETVLHNFGGSGDGKVPLYGRLLLVNGILYGTTGYGGDYEKGTIYSITPGSPSSYAIAYSFQGSTDGCHPDAGLVSYKKLLYGTAHSCGTYGAGTIFAIDPTSHVFTLVWSFGGAPGGENPKADLVAVGGTIYGTTWRGGANGYGTVFSFVSRL